LAFNYIDKDSSGKLSVKVLRDTLGNNVSEHEYESMLKKFDKNSDGEISRY